MTASIEKSLQELDFASLTRRTFTPSPAAWEDQVLYFLLLDRFSGPSVWDPLVDAVGSNRHGRGVRPGPALTRGSAPAAVGRVAPSKG
jgi:hypothetical protein